MTTRGKGEGSIYRHAGRWYGSVELPPVSGKRRRKTVSSTDKSTTIKRLRKLQTDVDNGLIASSATETVKDWLDYWLENVAKPRVRPSTYRSYQAGVRTICAHIGHIRLQRLVPADVRYLAKQVTQTHSTGTASNVHKLLGQALTAAVNEGKLNHSVVDRTAAPKVKPVEGQPLSMPQTRNLLQHCDNPEDLTRWTIALLLGLRQGEALGLRWSDLDLERTETLTVSWQLNRLPMKPGGGYDVPESFEYYPLVGSFALVRPKTRQALRTIPLPSPVLAALKTFAEQWVPNEWGLLFTSGNGTPRRSEDDAAAWRAALARAEIPTRTQHSARHTTATLLLEAGIDPHIVAATLGHTNIKMTRHYQKVSDDLQRQALGQITS